MANNTDDHAGRHDHPEHESHSSSDSNGFANWSLDQIVQNLTRTGRRWGVSGSSPTTITYSFPTTVSSDYATGREKAGFSGMSSAQKAGVERALSLWADVANIKFVKAEGNDAQMHFANTTTGPKVAWAYYPASGRGGDVWVNPNYSHNSRLNNGDYGHMTLVHEIGHALGLSHPGNYNGSASAGDRGYAQDSHKYSVMSYFGNADYRAYPATPMLHDVAAAQKLYGANMTTRTGDNVYQFATDGKDVRTIWDAGGIDTISAANQSRGATINLNEGSYSSFGNVKGNVAVAYGAKIENAVGSSRDDNLIGNGLDNVLDGGTGNDRLSGGAGNDTLKGGAGNDTYVFNAGWGSDVIHDSDARGHIRFADVNRSDLSFSRNGDSLVISRLDSDDSVTFKDVFSGNADITFSAKDGGFKPPISGLHNGRNHGGVVEVGSDEKNVLFGTTLDVKNLITAYDPDGDAITSFRVTKLRHKEGGHFELDGKIINPGSDGWGESFTVSTEEMSRLKYVTADRGDKYWHHDTGFFSVEAFDGNGWGNRANVKVKANFDFANNNAPTLTVTDMNVNRGDFVSVKDILNISDAEGDKIRMVRFWDATVTGSGRWDDDKSGHFRTDHGSGYYTPGRWQTMTLESFDKLRFFAGQTGMTDELRFQAYDGAKWSKTAVAKITTVDNGLPANRKTVVEAKDVSISPGQQLSAMDLFSSYDPDHDKNSKFRFMDATGNAGSATLTLDGAVQAAGQWVEVDWRNLVRVRLTGGAKDGVDNIKIQAYSDSGWSDVETSEVVTRTLSKHQAPKLQADYSRRMKTGEVVQASSMFTVTEGSEAVTKFRFIDNNGQAGSARLMVDGVQQQAGLWVEVSAADLNKVSFVGGEGGNTDNIQFQAYDGTEWSRHPTTMYIHSTPGNRAPTVVGRESTTYTGRSMSLNGLFYAFDSDGDAITHYRIKDMNADGDSASLKVNGVAQPAGQWITISAADKNRTSVFTGDGAGTNAFEIQAFDGKNWSKSVTSTLTTKQANRAPVVADKDVKIDKGAVVSASDVFDVTDADGDAITEYRIYDANRRSTSGHFEIDGKAISTSGWVTVKAADFEKLTFRSATVGGTKDLIYVQAKDGAYWSNYGKVRITSGDPNRAPVVSTGDKTMDKGDVVAASSLFTVTDADGDTITKYRFYDSNRSSKSGYFTQDGVQMTASGWITVSADEMAKMQFHAGVSNGQRDTLYVQAYDGEKWSNYARSTITTRAPVNHAPIVSAGAKKLDQGKVMAASELFNVTDVDGDAMTKYRFYDHSTSTRSGYFMLDGKKVMTAGFVNVDAKDLSRLTFAAGDLNGVTDTIRVQAFDGQTWSNSAYSRVTTIGKVNHAPVVVAKSTTVDQGKSIAATDLFSVTDKDGDAMTQFRFYDSNRNSASGYFTLNGEKVGEGQWTTVSASDLENVRFHGGASNGQRDYLYVQAFDGDKWSNYGRSTVTTKGRVNHAPVVSYETMTVKTGASMSIQDMFKVTDADGDAITQYRFYDTSSSATSGSLRVNGNVQAARKWVTVNASDIDQTRFVAGSVGGRSDYLYAQAFDGMKWSNMGRVSIRAEVSDDSIGEATDMGLVAQRSTYKYGNVGAGDAQDYYKFRVSSDSRVSLSLYNYYDDGDLYLYDKDGNQLAMSKRSGRSSEYVTTNLKEGDYHVAVKSDAQRDNRYRLSTYAVALRDTTGITFASASSSSLVDQTKKQSGLLAAA